MAKLETMSNRTVYKYPLGKSEVETLPPGTYEIAKLIANPKEGGRGLWLMVRGERGDLYVDSLRYWFENDKSFIYGETDEFEITFCETRKKVWRWLPPKYGSQIRYSIITENGKRPIKFPSGVYEAQFLPDRNNPKDPSLIVTHWNSQLIGISTSDFLSDMKNSANHKTP